MLNKVILQGRLTANPELKSTANGVSVCAFTLAVDRSYQSGGERQADFINCVAWRGTAEFISKYFSKGRMAIVCGELQVRKYTTNEGQTRSVTEVIVNDVNFGGDKKEAASNEAPAHEEILADDDFPF